MEVPKVDTSFFGNRSKEAYAIQAHLRLLGFDPGPIDGIWGVNSQTAYDRWIKRSAAAAALNPVNSMSTKLQLLTTAEAIEIFGQPGVAVENSLVKIRLPYEMHLEWAPQIKITQIRVHRKLASLFTSVFMGINAAYSQEELTALGLREFSGVYSHRRVTGGAAWSKHAFGIAIDLYAENNGFNVPWHKADFSRAVYDPVHLAFERAGFINIGKIIGKDAMHFEITASKARTLRGDFV